METRKKILFCVLYPPDRAPSQRFRFEQYLDHLEANGYDHRVSSILSSADHKRFYRKGAFFSKVFILIKGFFKRLRDLLNLSSYDLIFVQREAYLLGSSFFEKAVARSKVPLIYDFDDAIWLHNSSAANKRFSWLKDPSKTGTISSLADHVIVGNDFLKAYAERFNNNVSVIPTTIDTEKYDPKRVEGKGEKETIVIGWSGSITTIQHFQHLREVLLRLKEKYGALIRFEVIGDGNFYDPDLDVQGKEWRKEDEIQEIGRFDIGIMPLPDTEWAKGKCALKALQYMALEVPPVISPVGMNEEVIEDGVNGFLAGFDEEWLGRLELLIEDRERRHRMGREARKTVQDRYSVRANRKLYIQSFERTLKLSRKRSSPSPTSC